MMLKAQCRSPGGRITSTKLAEAAVFENYNAATLQYGTLGSNRAGVLGFKPQTRPDGTPMWWTTLSYSEDGVAEPETRQFHFIVRPELAAALKEMRWA